MGVPKAGLSPRTPRLAPGEGCGVGDRVTAELPVGVGCGDGGTRGDPALAYGTLLCAATVLPGATEVGGCSGMGGGRQVRTGGMWLCSGVPSESGGPNTPVVGSRATPRLGVVTPGVLAVVVGTGRPDPLPVAGGEVGPVPTAGWAVLARGPPRPPAPRDGREGRGAERGPCQAMSVPRHGRESEPRPPAGPGSPCHVPCGVPAGLSSLCSPPTKGDVPVIPSAGLPVAGAMLG